MTRSLPSLRTLLRQHPAPVTLTATALLLEGALRCVTPIAAALFIDHAIGQSPRNTLFLSLAALALAVLSALAAGLLRDLLYARLESRLLESVRQTLYEGLLGASATSAASLLEDLEEVETAFASWASWGALPLLECVGATALAFLIDWHVGAIAALLWPFVILVPRPVTRRAESVEGYRREQSARVAAIVAEALRAQSIIRAFSLEARSSASFRAGNSALRNLGARANLLAAFAERFTSSGILLLQMVALALSAWFVHIGRLSPGQLVGLQMLLAMTGGGLQYLSEYIPSLASASLAWSRLREQFPAPPAPATAPKQLPPFSQEILFTGVRSGLLDHVSFRIRKGTHVAFVGPTGCGKSAILRLLMRLEQPTAGSITLDGFRLDHADLPSLRNQLGAVLQDNFIFGGTLHENIRLGGPNVATAAESAGLAPLIAALPDGIETRVGEGGARLSHADAQRLALARALARDPAILLLDEITSALDPADEESINQALRLAAAGRTVISASHRLSSTAHADLICLLLDGRIAEQGTHFELMALKGQYAALWRKQAGFRFSTDGRHVDVDAQRLRELPILDSLNEEILAELAPFFATENFPEGREIVRQNDPGDKFYIIVRGKVEVWRSDDQTGTTVRVALLEDGDFFGEITLITGFPRTATVRTATAATCISLERAQFIRLMERFPEISREISAIAMQRFMDSSKATRDWR